jgi:hypothetical protein
MRRGIEYMRRGSSGFKFLFSTSIMLGLVSAQSATTLMQAAETLMVIAGEVRSRLAP